MATNATPSLTLDASLAVSGHVLAQEFDGAMTLLNTRSEQYFSLDDVGTRMWEVLVQTQTLREAHAQLADEFDVEPEQLARDLVAFAAELVESRLIVVEADGAPA